MSEKTTIARPYAQAVFELARDNGNSSEWSATLDLLSRIVADGQMQLLLSNPKISDAQLFDIVSAIAGDNLPQQSRNFVKILLAANRMQYAPQIRQLFEALRKGYEQAALKSGCVLIIKICNVCPL